MKVTFFKDDPDALRHQDLKEPGFDNEYIIKSEMMRRIRDRAWSMGKELGDEESDTIFLNLLARNRADLESGKTKSVMLDFDDPPIVPVNTPTEALAEGAVMGATFGNLDIFPEQGNEDPFAMAAGAYGNVKSMIGGPIRALKGTGLPGPVAFGAYGAASPAESTGDRVKNAALNTALGVGLEVAPGALTMGATKINPKLGYNVAKGLGTKPGRFAYDVGLFGGLGFAHDPKAEPINILADALGGASAVGALAGRGGKNKKASENKPNLRFSDDGMRVEAVPKGETPRRFEPTAASPDRNPPGCGRLPFRVGHRSRCVPCRAATPARHPPGSAADAR